MSGWRSSSEQASSTTDPVLLPKPQRQTNEDFLEHLRGQACVTCGRPPRSQPSHLKTVGSRGGDYTACAQCFDCHRKWHDLGPETAAEHFRRERGVDIHKEQARQLAEYFSDPVVIFRLAVRFMAGPDELPSEVVLAIGQMLEELNRRAGTPPRPPRRRRKATRIPIG